MGRELPSAAGDIQPGCARQMPPAVLVHRKGFPSISCSLKTWQPETCPPPPENSSSASPVRCSLGGRGHPPGAWVHSKEPPLGGATPPTGHAETGPVEGGDRSAGDWEWGLCWREAARSLGFEKWPWWGVQARGTFQLFPGWRGHRAEELWPSEDQTGLGTDQGGHRPVHRVGGRGTLCEPQRPVSKAVTRSTLGDPEAAVNMYEPLQVNRAQN